MELSKGAKIVFIIIWTGILLGAAGLIVKGGKVFEMDMESFLKEKISMEALAQNSAFFEYLEDEERSVSYNPYVGFLFKGWPFAVALRGSKDTDSVYVEYEEGEGDVDYSVLYGNTEFPIITGETYNEEENQETVSENLADILKANQTKINKLKKEMDAEYLLKNFYVVDKTTSADTSIFNVKKMLSKDYSIKKSKSEPQILIFHTHGSTESFAGSKKGSREESIIGVGSYLADILEEEYGYHVIHDETAYDMVNGKTDRNKAYNQALSGVQKTLKKYPSIQVVIDLHRDGVAGKEKRLTMVNGKKTAQIMLFNGLSRNKNGPIEYLANENLEDNLAFSLQLKLLAMEAYPNFTTANYLKGYRYNLHLAKRSLLIELGNQNNTFEEAKNAMEPLADILNQVLE